MLDGDWCWCADPFQVTPETKLMVLDNICHLLGNFLRCGAYENVILCWAMHERAIIDEILGRLPIEGCGAEVRVVSLVASDDELRRHIEGDIRAGLRDEAAVARSLSYLPRYRDFDTELIDTTDLTPHESSRALSHPTDEHLACNQSNAEVNAEGTASSSSTVTSAGP